MAKSKYAVVAGHTGSGWASSIYEIEYEGDIAKVKQRVAGVYFSLRKGAVIFSGNPGIFFDSRKDALKSGIVQMLTSGKIKEPGKLQEAHHLFIRKLFEAQDPLPIYFERQYKELVGALSG